MVTRSRKRLEVWPLAASRYRIKKVERIKVALQLEVQVLSHIQRVLDDAHKNRIPHGVVSLISWIWCKPKCTRCQEGFADQIYITCQLGQEF